jgi:hypothetical protein
MSVDHSIANIVIAVWDVEDVEIAIVDWIEAGMLQKNHRVMPAPLCTTMLQETNYD